MALYSHSGFFNATLGKQQHNNESIEVLVMRRFLCDFKLTHVQLPTEFQSLMYPNKTITTINVNIQKYSHVGGPVFNFGSNGKSTQRNS